MAGPRGLSGLTLFFSVILPITSIDTDCCPGPHSMPPRPRIVLLGETGVGKSTLGNRLFAKKPGMCASPNSMLNQTHPVFGVGNFIYSHTNETSWIAGKWLGNYSGNGSCFTLIDTPGIRDNVDHDCRYTVAISEAVKNLSPIDAFVLIFKGTQYRLTKPLQDQLSFYQEMFGEDFWKRTIIEVSYWRSSEDAKEERMEDRQTDEAKFSHYLNMQLKKKFGLTQAIPVYFIDPMYTERRGKRNPEEKETFKNETEKLWNFTQSGNPYKCKGHCTNPGFLQGEPALKSNASVRARLTNTVIMEFSIWFSGCDGKGDRNYDIYKDGVQIWTVIDEQGIDGKERKPKVMMNNEHTPPNMDVFDECSHVQGQRMECNVELSKYKNIKVVLKDIAESAFGNYSVNNTNGRSQEVHIQKIVDGVYSEWADWSGWDEVKGAKVRMRDCMEPVNGGAPCSARGLPTEQCNSDQCSQCCPGPDGLPPRPRILVLGETGVGKSTLGQRLFAKKPGMCTNPNSMLNQTHPVFGVGNTMDSHTNETSWISGKWLGDYSGNSSCFTVIDTPGVGDSDHRDCQHGMVISEAVKNLSPIDAFVLVFKGTQSRFTKPLQDQLSFYQDMFGEDFWIRTIIEVSYWRSSEDAKEERMEDRQTDEAKFSYDLNMQLKKKFGLTQAIPVYFIDPMYTERRGRRNPEEKETFKNETEKLWKFTQSDYPYTCKGHCKGPAFLQGEQVLKSHCGSEGVLTSPGHPANYPSNLSRTDILLVEQGRVIYIKFTAFNVDQANDSKCWDHLTLTEGDRTPLMAKSCGSDIPLDLASNTGTVRVIFHSSTINERSGWRLEWTAVSPGCPTMTPTPGLPCLTPPDLKCGYEDMEEFCCGHSTTFSCVTNTSTGDDSWQVSDSPCPEAGCGGGGVLTSPGHPANYPSNLSRTDIIQVEQGRVIYIKFTAFAVENSTSCKYDYLTLTEGDGTTLMAKTCGSNLPPDLISTTGHVRIIFHTDYSITGLGWRLEWTAFPTEALVFSSGGPAATEQSPRMGDFLKMAGVTRNNHPVWQKGAGVQFLFFDDTNNWLVGTNYTGHNGGVASVGTNLPSPPHDGWQFYSSTEKKWLEDPQLKVQGGAWHQALTKVKARVGTGSASGTGSWVYLWLKNSGESANCKTNALDSSGWGWGSSWGNGVEETFTNSFGELDPCSNFYPKRYKLQFKIDCDTDNLQLTYLELMFRSEKYVWRSSSEIWFGSDQSTGWLYINGK